MKAITNLSFAVLIVASLSLSGFYCNEVRKLDNARNYINDLENRTDSIKIQIDTIFYPVEVIGKSVPDTIYREKINFQIVTESNYSYLDSVSGVTLHIKAFGPCQVDSFQFKTNIKRPVIYSNTKEFKSSLPNPQPLGKIRRPFNISLGVITGKSYLGPRVSFIMPNGHIGLSYDPMTSRGLVDAGFNIFN